MSKKVWIILHHVQQWEVVVHPLGKNFVGSMLNTVRKLIHVRIWWDVSRSVGRETGMLVVGKCHDAWHIIGGVCSSISIQSVGI